MSRKNSTAARLLALSLLCLSLNACAETLEENLESVARFELSLIESRPHSADHFTQGLFFWDGVLYESVGQYGESALIKYSGDSSAVSVRRKLQDQYFAEGATVLNDRIYQLTWKAGKSFVYSGPMLSVSRGFDYAGEGWGLASDGTQLWLSNGSDQLQQLDSQGHLLTQIAVTYRGQPLNRLNELEWVKGWLLANRWYDNRIFAIDPNTGIAEKAFDLTQIANTEMAEKPNNVLNGIAWNRQTETLWITGKNWRQFYLMKLVLPPI